MNYGTLSIEEFLEEWNSPSTTMPVQTSGSTGIPKTIRVEKRRMLASARLTCDFLGLQQGDTALLCLSADYIAGKMMLVRSIERNLRLTTVEPSGHPLSQLQESRFALAAMVPMQVWNSLQVPSECALLRQIRHLVIGGGAISQPLAEALCNFPNAIWSTYGMTETLSHIALRRLNGRDRSEWYEPLPGVSLSLSPDDCLIIQAPNVCAEPLCTHDIAELRPDGRFRILGRLDNVICSGGLKIQPEQIEARLAPHLNAPFLITKCHDAKFGEAVVLLTEGIVDEARQICSCVLSRYHQPRRYLHIDRIPLTPTGKPARLEAQKMADIHQ